MLYVLLAILIIVAFVITFQRVELGFAIIIVIPLFKDVFLLPTEQIPILNLSFIFAIFTIMSFVYNYSFNINKIRLEQKHIILFLAFVLMLLISLIYTNEMKYGIEKVAKFIFFNGFLFVGGMVVFQEEKRTRNFIEFLKYSILIISIVNVVLLIKYLLSGTLLQHIIVRFTITESNNPINLARVAGLGVLLWFLSIFQSKDLKHKIIGWLALIPIIVSLIATNTRGPILFTLLIILGYLFFYLNISIKQKILAIGLLVVVGIALMLILPESMYNRFSLLFQKGNLNIEKNLWMSSSSGRRLIFAKRILQYVSNHPLTLFAGVGAGGFANLFKDYGIYSYPHNIFLEILFEQGLVGISIFMFSIIIFIEEINIVILRNNKFKELLLPLLFSVIYFFLNAQVSGDIERNRLLWLFWGASIGVMIQYFKSTTRVQNISKFSHII